MFGELFPLFHGFHSLSFRIGGAMVTSFMLSFMLFPTFIAWLKRQQPQGQPIRKEVSCHASKHNTPTMGGLMILLSTSISSVLWSDGRNISLSLVMLVMWGYGILGMVDDYKKLTQESAKGLSMGDKLLPQSLIALLGVMGFLMVTEDLSPMSVSIPFFKGIFLELGWFVVPFSVFVVVGSSNAVNLTDGLDGLAIVPVMIACVCFMIIVLIISDVTVASSLHIRYIPGTKELMIFCGALFASGISFLWFNKHPAKVFMGDTGSLALGGALGMMSVVTKHEFVWSIVGGVFVAEAVSVILQILSAKLQKRGYIKHRVFLMAPLHHHFEQLGWRETSIVIRFWVMAFLLGLLGLSTLILP